MLARRAAILCARFHGAGRWWRALICLMLGGVIALGQAPTDWWWLALAGLAVAMALTDTSGTARRGFGVMWWIGAGYFAVALRWIVAPFLVDPAQTGWMAPFAIVLMAAGAGLFWGAAGWISVRFGRAQWPGLVLALTLTEAVRALVLTGFPWALVGHIWIDTPLVQAAAWVGPHGLTLLALAVAWALSRVVFGRWWLTVVPLAAVVLAVALVPRAAPAPDADAPVIRIVQPHVPQQQKWDPAFRDANFARMLDLTSAAPRPDLIVWPETAIPVLMSFAGSEMFQAAEAARGVPLITGLNRSEGARYYNALIRIDADGQAADIYDKAHLAPFGEYIPGGEWLRRFGIRGLAASEGGAFSAGGVQPLMDLPGIGPARMLICYEGIFAEEVGHTDRPRLMVLITNDAWFGNGAGPTQHLAQARLRAVEQGLPMVRAANTGISAMIDAQGRVLHDLPLNTAGAIDAPLPPAAAATTYTRWGDWPVLMLALLSLIACAALSPRDK